MNNDRTKAEQSKIQQKDKKEVKKRLSVYMQSIWRHRENMHTHTHTRTHDLSQRLSAKTCFTTNVSATRDVQPTVESAGEGGEGSMLSIPEGVQGGVLDQMVAADRDASTWR